MEQNEIKWVDEMEIIPFVTGGGVKKGVRNGNYRLDQVKS